MGDAQLTASNRSQWCSHSSWKSLLFLIAPWKARMCWAYLPLGLSFMVLDMVIEAWSEVLTRLYIWTAALTDTNGRCFSGEHHLWLSVQGIIHAFPWGPDHPLDEFKKKEHVRYRNVQKAPILSMALAGFGQCHFHHILLISESAHLQKAKFQYHIATACGIGVVVAVFRIYNLLQC